MRKHGSDGDGNRVDVIIPKMYSNINESGCLNMIPRTLNLKVALGGTKRDSYIGSNHFQSSSELATKNGVKGTAFYMKHHGQKGVGDSEIISLGNTHVSQGTAPTEKELTTLGARQSISHFPSEINHLLKFNKQIAGQTKLK